MDEIQLVNKRKIDLLFNKLTNQGYEHFEKFILELNINAETLRPFAMWSEDKYQRVCIAHDDNAELILLCWGEGQGSPIHSHDKQECWVHIVDGKITETLYESNSSINIMSKRTISKGAFTYLTDEIGFHKLENNSDKITMSIHLYANPIEKCEVYDKSNDCFVSMSLKYDKCLDTNS